MSEDNWALIAILGAIILMWPPGWIIVATMYVASRFLEWFYE